MNETTECVLRVSVGHAEPAELALGVGDEVIIGTGPDVGFRIEDRQVEHQHVRVVYDDKGIHLIDLGSRRGVQVNGRKCPVAELGNGDRIRVGSTTLRVMVRANVGAQRMARARKKAHRRVPAAALEVVGAGADVPEPSAADFASEEISHVEPGGPLAGLAGTPPLELQHVWFQVRRDESWRSLAVVPADPETPTLPVVHSFARMAALNPNARVLVVDATTSRGIAHDSMLVEDLGSAVRTVPGARYDLLDASALGLNDAELAHVYVPQLLEYIETGSGRHNTVLIALGSLLEHATSIPIARAVDAVLISVALGHTRLSDVEHLVEILGRERVVGSVVID